METENGNREEKETEPDKEERVRFLLGSGINGNPLNVMRDGRLYVRPLSSRKWN